MSAEGDWKVPPETVKARYAKAFGLLSGFLSTTGHVKPCGNLGGPSPKAKYYSVTDSEQVP